MNYISKINVNLFDVFTEQVNLLPGLNIISGENGTCKSHFLRSLKQLHDVEVFGDQNQLQRKIFAFNPKRNSQRQNLEQVFQTFRQQNKGFDSFVNETIQKQFNDQDFDNYSSCSQLFYIFYDKKCKAGGDQRQYMNEVCQEFNAVMSSVFDDYVFCAKWDEAQGAPNLELLKRGSKIPINAVSCGEQEILSLILNIYSAKDSVDVYLIDEPEVHLNWHLEEKLFDFLYNFSEQHQKQIILTTHSRVIFKQRFHELAKFFAWKDGKIKVESELPDEQRKRIAGEAIEIIKLGDFSKTTIFIEDESQKCFIEVLSKLLESEVTPVICGNSSNVKSLFKLSEEEGGWKKCYFVIDGDNQGNPFPNKASFIHLDKYCIENYVLDTFALSKALDTSELEIKELILNAILDVKHDIFKKNKFFEFLVDRLGVDDINNENLTTLDASVVFKSLLRKINHDRRELFEKVLPICLNNKTLPEKLVDAINENKLI